MSEADRRRQKLAQSRIALIASLSVVASVTLFLALPVM
jgi:hypothetical protein